MESECIAASPETTPESLAPQTLKQAEIDLCGYAAAKTAAMKSANETHAAANAADTLRYGKHLSTLTEGKEGEGEYIASMGTISRITATEEEINRALHDAALVATEEEGEI